jgi:nucleoside-diphosphate-sugar epimerase
VRTLVAQSYAGWPTAPRAGALTTEDDPWNPAPPPMQRESLAAIQSLERAVTNAPLRGIVLRYGNFYGPGASEKLVEMLRKRRFPLVGGGEGVWSWIHLDDAATATVAAVERGAPGVYDIVDDEPAPVSAWLPYLAAAVHAPPPRRVPVWLARLGMGEVGVAMMTRIHGASNAKAKRDLGWRPAWTSWRDGFRDGLAVAEAA